jgi:hypothetical protein
LVIPCDQSQNDTWRDAETENNYADYQRESISEDHPAKDVTPDAVGPEKVL